MLSSNAIGDAYKVSGAGAAVVNGIYAYYGTYDTFKDDYEDPPDGDRGPMPVYRKTGTDYYLGYRGCSTKWVILVLPYGPDGDPNDPYDDDLAGGWVSGYMYGNYNDTLTPPSIGWHAKHHNDTPDPPPIVKLYIPPTIALNKSTLSRTAVQGTNASSQFFEVWNSGGDTLTYSISDNRTWLSCTPTSGNSTGGHDSIQVSYASAGLSAGTYSATITISDSSATNSPRTISVSLTVAEPSPAITISSGSLSNFSAQGTNAPSQGFDVWNSGGGVLNYAISDNVSWLSCTPISGISTGEHDTVQVAYASAGLSTGAHSATIAISSAGTGTKYVTVSLQVVDRITIETQPISQTKYIQQNVTFSVAVSGPPPLSYQWKKNNTAISGATSTSYTIVNLTQGHAGDYTCVVENGLESKESDRATLEVFLNDAPVITGQNPNPLVTTRGGTFTILLDNLVVNDENDDFPNDFTLNVMGGDDYTVDGHIVILSETFEGDMLNVPVSVHDGIDASNVYTLSIAINMGEPVVENIHNAPAGVSNAVWY
ncbi:MAG: immunoglobulin domain-containing protein, partial [Deltaproteobacteria bacterium]|nr:immunoglobulin domain-containing protein [Deltaproteobacteria bacterium]